MAAGGNKLLDAWLLPQAKKVKGWAEGYLLK